jgi:hypothetical protein
MCRKTDQIDQARHRILAIGSLGAVAPRGDDQDALFSQSPASEPLQALAHLGW